MPAEPLRYGAWSATCDTLHAHAQLLGKLAVALAPPEPQLQHVALRLDARGWHTLPLPLGSGVAVVVRLDLYDHEAVVQHSDGRVARVPLTPNRAVADVAREVLDAVGGDVEINPTPQDVHWSVPLDEDREHATYDPEAVAAYFAAATRAALVLSEFRAPYRGRSTAMNAWWGSFDLAVSLFSGEPATPPSNDFIVRNSMDAQEVAVGWWPGDPRYDPAAYYGYAHPAPEGFAEADLSPARWSPEMGLYVLDEADVVAAADPHAVALEFARSLFDHACALCDWDPGLAASAKGDPPPVA